MRAPAEFLVTRHLITHPDDGPSDIARHERIHVPTASNALTRIRNKHDLWTEAQLLAHLRTLAERPKWRTHGLRLPNPQRWVDNYDGRHLISGEPAAVIDGFDLIPERHLVYVEPTAMNQAVQLALDEGGALAHHNQANLVLKTMDPWLYEEPEGYAERGQRLLDYADSKHIQLLNGLRGRSNSGDPEQTAPVRDGPHRPKQISADAVPQGGMAAPPREIQVLSERMAELVKHYGVTRIQVYGSIARGEAGPDSDVDLLVEFEAPPSLFHIGRLQADIETMLGRRVDIATPGGFHPRILAAVRKEAIDVGGA